MLSNIFDVRSFRGADCDTDHYLVVAKVRERLAVSKQAAQKFHAERFNLKMLNALGVWKQYQIKISKMLAALENLNDREDINPLNPQLNPICYLLALLGAHHFLHVSRIRVKLLTFGLLMSHIYGAPILDVSRSHTTTQHSR